ncbi:MAG TPA: hypothetical protein VND90_07200, partial [Terracidiphilus sp.]|nr:hypothetical protein [Terracidiphilus sp.]
DASANLGFICGYHHCWCIDEEIRRAARAEEQKMTEMARKKAKRREGECVIVGKMPVEKCK